MADLLPSVHHVPVAWVMAYDTRPLLTLDEKAAFLSKAAAEQYVLFLEHDPNNQCCMVQQTEKGVRLSGPSASPNSSAPPRNVPPGYLHRR